jgi:hypothetical protein
MSELEIIHLSYAERDAAFRQLMKSAAKTLPFIPGNRSNPRPVIRTGPSRGVVALERAKAKRIAPPKRPDRIRVPKAGARLVSPGRTSPAKGARRVPRDAARRD